MSGYGEPRGLSFGCASGCEHSEMRVITAVPSTHRLHPRPPLFFSGRADNACTNLLGYLVRYVRTRGSMRLRRAAKPPTCALPRVAHTCHAWLARLTRARGRCFLRGRKALLNDFWYFSSRKSTPFLLKKKLSRATAVARFLFFAKRKKQECRNIPAFFIIILRLP